MFEQINNHCCGTLLWVVVFGSAQQCRLVFRPWLRWQSQSVFTGATCVPTQHHRQSCYASKHGENKCMNDAKIIDLFFTTIPTNIHTWLTSFLRTVLAKQEAMIKQWACYASAKMDASFRFLFSKHQMNSKDIAGWWGGVSFCKIANPVEIRVIWASSLLYTGSKSSL